MLFKVAPDRGCSESWLHSDCCALLQPRKTLRPHLWIFWDSWGKTDKANMGLKPPLSIKNRQARCTLEPEASSHRYKVEELLTRQQVM